MTHTYIPESEAAALLGYAPQTLRNKVLAKKTYKGKEPLPIAITSGGKGYRYSLQDIEKQLRISSSARR
jgi:hypothetical protein